MLLTLYIERHSYIMAILELPDELVNTLSQLASTRNRSIESLIEQLITRDATYENSMDSLLIVDDDMNYVDVNPAACDLLGYSREELLQLNIIDVVPNEELTKQDWEKFNEDEEVNGEYTLKHKDGHDVHVEYVAVSHVTSNRHMSVFRNVTARKQMEEQLRESERRFTAFMDNAPMVAYIKDSESNYIFSNRYLVEQIESDGYTFDNQTPYERFAPEVAQKIKEADQQVLVNREIVTIEDYAMYENEKVNWYKEIKFPIEGINNSLYVGGFAIDITEQKETEAQLRKREAFITQITDTLPGVIYVHDINTHTNVYTNKKTADILDYTSEELQSLGDNLLKVLTHPDDFKKLMQHFSKIGQATDDREIFELTYRMKHKDGHWRWFNSRDKIAQRDEDGNVQHIMGIAIDITEQEHLRLEQQHMLDRSPIPIGIAKLDGTIEYYNDVFTQTFGYTQADTPTIDEWRIKAYPDPEYRQKAWSQWTSDLTHALETNNLLPVRHYHITDKWGENHIVSIQASVIRERIFSTFIDVTEQQRMQQALIQSEQRYRTIFDNAMYSIVIYNMDGTIQMINNAAAAALNRTPDELIGHLLEDFYPNSHEQTIEFLNKVVEAEDITYVEETVNVDGEAHIIWSVGQAIYNERGEVEGVQVISHDVTTQRQAEAYRQQQQQLELSLKKQRQISQLRTRLLTTISHEFRTPLAIIQTNTEMLMRYRDRFTPERQDQKLNQIVAQISHLTGMLDNVRTMNQAQQNDMQYHPTNVNLSDFIQTLNSDFVESRNQPQPLNITVDTTKEMIVFDSNLMRQALGNLLSNASKYSPEDTTISLTIRQNNDTLLFIVSDEGIGISRADQPNIYQPFFRGKNAENVRGTGLGLAIVREIVELHRGHITCESQLDHGTTFTISLSTNLIPA